MVGWLVDKSTLINHKHKGFSNSWKKIGETVKQNNEVGPDKRRLLSKNELIVRFVAPKKAVCSPRQLGRGSAWPIWSNQGCHREHLQEGCARHLRRSFGKKGVFSTLRSYQDTAMEKVENVHECMTAPSWLFMEFHYGQTTIVIIVIVVDTMLIHTWLWSLRVWPEIAQYLSQDSATKLPHGWQRPCFGQQETDPQQHLMVHKIDTSVWLYCGCISL